MEVTAGSIVPRNGNHRNHCCFIGVESFCIGIWNLVGGQIQVLCHKGECLKSMYAVNCWDLTWLNWILHQRNNRENVTRRCSGSLSKDKLSRVSGPLMTEETLPDHWWASLWPALLELQERKLADVSVWDVLSARPCISVDSYQYTAFLKRVKLKTSPQILSVLAFLPQYINLESLF